MEGWILGDGSFLISTDNWKSCVCVCLSPFFLFDLRVHLPFPQLACTGLPISQAAGPVSQSGTCMITNSWTSNVGGGEGLQSRSGGEGMAGAGGGGEDRGSLKEECIEITGRN